VLSVGPGWDWPTLVGLYSDVATYTRQFRVLEEFVRQNPESAPARFVLAYHYITGGHLNEAVGLLRDVVRMQPTDKVSSQLLQQFEGIVKGGPAEAAPASPPAAAQPASPENTLVTTAAVQGSLAGTWMAQPSAETTITVSFTADGNFTWKVSGQGKDREFQGERTFGNGILTLVPSAGQAQPALVGRLTWRDEDHFTFKMLASPADDPGLSFARSH